MRQREMLTAGFKLTMDAAYVRARVTFHAVDAYRQYYLGPAGRIPAAIREQGTTAVDAYLHERRQAMPFMCQDGKFRVWMGKDGEDCAAQDREPSVWRAAEDLRASEDAM